LNSYMRRTSEDDIRQRMIATVNDERPTPTATLSKTPTAIKTLPATRPDGDDRITLPRPLKEFARGTTNAGRRAVKSSTNSGAKVETARNGSSPGLHMTSRAPSTAVRNPTTMVAAATARANAEASAATGASNSSEQATAAPEVSRIEIQTSDPNIRIIWLSPVAEETARPLK
ncbi:MAG: hypothetical protein QOG00_104, partial [Pyrinomonadaceae bacterium]|nr:hypothetical protein [Pyrinomonadaceae bacterium]